MLKEAIEKIEAMAKPEIYEFDGHTYSILADGGYSEIKPDLEMPETIALNSLDALVQMIKREAAQVEDDLFVSVVSHDKVSVFSSVQLDSRYERWMYYNAYAKDVPGWEPKMEMGFDEATVALLTRFQDGGDREYCIQLLSQITTGAHVTYTDNGIASTMVMKKGASLAENVTIKPIVRLRPYRTFQEVEQPEGLFLIRIRERGIAFIEADGGMWRLTARNTIKTYLEAELKDCGVTVML